MLLPVPWCVEPQQMHNLWSPKAAGKQHPRGEPSVSLERRGGRVCWGEGIK